MWSSNAARGSNKPMKQFMVLSAGAGLYSTRDIYAIRSDDPDSLSHVFRTEAACQNHPDVGMQFAELARGLPGEHAAAAAKLCSGRGVQNKHIGKERRQTRKRCFVLDRKGFGKAHAGAAQFPT